MSEGRREGVDRCAALLSLTCDSLHQEVADIVIPATKKSVAEASVRAQKTEEEAENAAAESTIAEHSIVVSVQRQQCRQVVVAVATVWKTEKFSIRCHCN